ncbi:bile acid:sodium symporter family protein [Rhabdobacter roseus]|uniref:BASS family bile acid:Na+ symporter n=1 Tax=Rhabdobacter roseus TaxID=1655419 RepID=A0A840TWW0_9BACT|nr:bile acid:sodium symporter family protein [Rhabdobacter roseus]MBB5284129.1 BASS family bile acid:Na+ symporter [Rhabdobacter roseus]
MQSNVLTELFLPLALALIMLGMGLSLVTADFKRIVLYPKAVALGILNQIVLLPIIAWLIVLAFGLSNELAVGIIILAACPGGPTSNLIAHLSRGDTALSITLTVVSSAIAVFTIPFLVNLAILHFIPDGQEQVLPIFKTIVSVIIITIIPVALGMGIRSRFPAFAARLERPVRILSAVFLFLIIGAALAKEKENLGEFFRLAGPATLLLNLLTMGVGYGTARLGQLSTKQSLTIAIESGIQNGTLGIAIASTLLQNAAMSVPSAIYSLLMFLTSIGIILLGNKIIDQKIPSGAA